MNRLTDAWFEYRGVSSLDMGVSMKEMPKRGLAFQKGKYVSVSGRDGGVFVSDGAYDNVDVSLTFDVRDGADVGKVDAWLAESGRLRFSDEPDRAYDARISKSMNRKSIAKRFDGQNYTVTFTCMPFKYAYPEPAAITVTTKGTIIQNPGTAPSRPRVKITGSGDFTVMIGTGAMWFEGVTDGGVIVDSELMDVLSYDASTLANDKAGGQPWQIAPGANTISWSYESGGSNAVTAVEILPRWRWR